MSTTLPSEAQEIQELDSVAIRFCGDSGDGMQLAGTQFTTTSAIFGNDVSTLPDFPSEIRAPAGSLPGVSGFQINFSSFDIHTPGDRPDVLVAMNPAAFKTNLPDLDDGGILIVNTDAFSKGNLKKAGYANNPLDDDSLRHRFRYLGIPLTSANRKALEEVEGLSTREVDRCKNLFALGVTYWMFDRPIETTLGWIAKKFASRPQIVEGNSKALKAGFHFGETAGLFSTHYRVKKRPVQPGSYRNITGNQATALGFLAAARQAGKPLVYASYPITPATDVLHELARYKHLDIRTFQAEDEIAAACAAIGASFGGSLALTGTSGPGVALKSEAINLAIILELPLVVLNVQRGGPSTGLPTKTEQSDLLQCLYGRNGESPVVVVAASTPSDCFDMAIEAFRIATQFMTPVFLLTDGYLGNGSEPWRIPEVDKLPVLDVEHPTDPSNFMPYSRDPETLARPWAVPGTPGLEHRLGGLEKEEGSGNVSYDPENHHRMCQLRAEKVQRVAETIPDLIVEGPEEGKVLVLGWGSTRGAILSGVSTYYDRGVASAHLLYINPFPKNLGEVLARYDRVLVPELNFGQLAMVLRAKYLIDVQSLPKLQGKPFKISEIRQAIENLLQEQN